MKIIEYFGSGDKAHWLSEIARSDWGAGAFLHSLLSCGKFFETLGEGSKLLLLTSGDELIAYCTYAKLDDIQPTELSPWMGFVYTFPAHRGRGCLGLLISEVRRLARSEGTESVYISTNREGLYEKYGAVFIGIMNDIDAAPSRVYALEIS